MNTFSRTDINRPLRRFEERIPLDVARDLIALWAEFREVPSTPTHPSELAADLVSRAGIRTSDPDRRRLGRTMLAAAERRLGTKAVYA